MKILETGPNEAPITELFAFLSIDPKGNEGICAAMIPELGTTPLVTSKARVAEMMKPYAAKMARAGHTKIRLVRFTSVDVVWSLDGADA